MIGVIPVGPRSSFRRLYVERGFIHVDGRPLAGNQICESKSILSSFSVKLGSIELGIPVSELRSEETDLILGIEALQLGSAYILLPDTPDDRRSLLD